MTDTKRMPKPMTKKQLAKYRELRAELIVQAELIMSIFDTLNDREYVTDVEFEMGHPDGPQIDIIYSGYAFGENYHEFFHCPESYLGMTEYELRAEKERIKEEEKRKKAEMAAKEKAAREKRKAEKVKKEKEKRHKKYLELKAEFDGMTESPEKKPVKEDVYICKYWAYIDDDLGSYCHNEKSGRIECGCKRTYAMQFCPFYERGKLRGKWVIDDVDKQAAEEFKKEFEGKKPKVEGL